MNSKLYIAITTHGPVYSAARMHPTMHFEITVYSFILVFHAPPHWSYEFNVIRGANLVHIWAYVSKYGNLFKVVVANMTLESAYNQ